MPSSYSDSPRRSQRNKKRPDWYSEGMSNQGSQKGAKGASDTQTEFPNETESQKQIRLAAQGAAGRGASGGNGPTGNEEQMNIDNDMDKGSIVSSSVSRVSAREIIETMDKRLDEKLDAKLQSFSDNFMAKLVALFPNGSAAAVPVKEQQKPPLKKPKEPTTQQKVQNWLNKSQETKPADEDADAFLDNIAKLCLDDVFTSSPAENAKKCTICVGDICSGAHPKANGISHERRDKSQIIKPIKSSDYKKPNDWTEPMTFKRTEEKPEIVIPVHELNLNECNPAAQANVQPVAQVHGDGGNNSNNETRYRQNFNTTLDESVAVMNQYASRQMYAKLPTMDGTDPLKVEPWLTHFYMTTELCGYNEQENWLRLIEPNVFSGEALRAVQGLLSHHSHVPKILDRIKERFGREESIVEVLMKPVREAPKQKLEAPFIGIIKFADSLDNLVRTLETYASWSRLASPEFIAELEGKLSGGLMVQWIQAKNKAKARGVVTAKTFSDWLNILAANFRDVAYAQQAMVPNLIQQRDNRRSNRVSGQLHAHVDTISSDSESPVRNERPTSSRKCWHCNSSDHFAPDCAKFKKLNVNDRWTAMHEAKSICYSCLRKGHQVQACNRKKKCETDDCTYYHHPLLHSSKSEQTTSSSTKMPSVEKLNKVSDKATEIVHASHLNDNNTNTGVLLKLLPVRLWVGDKYEEVVAMLDEGSSWSLMDQEIAQRLNVAGTKMPLCIRWSANTLREENESECVTLQVSGVHHQAQKHILDKVRTVRKLDLPVTYPNIAAMMRKYQHLRGIPIPEFTEVSPRLIIGCANWNLGQVSKVKSGERHEPVAGKTSLGWILFGRYDGQDNPMVNVHVCECQEGATKELVQLVKSFVVESDIGVPIPKKIIESDEDARAREILKTTTKRIGNRFETGLLWKTDDIELPDSLPMAERRLACTMRKVEADSEYRELYRSEIAKLIEKGWATKLTTEQAELHGPRTWYLPHFGVTNPNKPGRVRLVFDAAAEVKKTSLNSVLLTGPDLNASLFNVLLQWRVGKVAFMGDVEAMFHQVLIKKDDRDSLRFLYPNAKNEIETFRMNVAIFGSKCSPTSAQFVKNINATEWEEEFPDACAIIHNNTYVDNVAASDDSSEKAISKILDVREVFTRCGMNCRDFVSNSPEVMEAIGEAACDKAKVSMNMNEQFKERVLGMIWDVKKDVLKFSLNFPKVDQQLLNNQRVPTKTDVLRVMMSVFDPLGLLSHFMVFVKTLFQDIWSAGIGWNDKLPPRLMKRWTLWLDKLQQLQSIELPRYYSEKVITSNKIMLCIFCDASRDSYAAVAYFRFSDNDGHDVAMVAAKTKVAPRGKPISIPRCELNSIVIGSRLAVSILKGTSLKVDEVVCFTDAKNNLLWLQSDQRKYAPFVAHRVSEVLENTELKWWRWISTKENVADDATKWANDVQFHSKNRFLTGPDFLYTNEDVWPADFQRAINEESLEERKAEADFHFAEEKNVLIDPERFSNWRRMARSMAYVLRMVQKHPQKRSKELEVDEIEKGESQIYRQVQFEAFKSEIKALREGKPIAKSSPLYRLSPYIDEQNIIRIRGRIDNAMNVPDGMKRPIILPKDHRVTKLIVHYFHKKYLHQFSETVVNELKQIYYIPDMRRVVKSVATDCQMCKVRKAKPIIPEMGSLPAARLAPFVRPFSYVGVDYFGHYWISIGRKRAKRYGVIFTCMTTRAVHFEVAYSLNTNSCIMCIRNFIARRGTPVQMYSDNGTNLKAADSELKKAIDSLKQERLIQMCAEEKFQWNFNPPMAPHWGGAFERLIQTTKNALNATIPTDSPPDDEAFRNFLMEVERIINSRPLTYMPVGPDEIEALTPFHFLLGSSSGAKAPGDFTYINLKAQWEFVQQLTEIFWKRWIKEYLPTLVCRTKWYDRKEPLKVGDLVFFAIESERDSWRRGRIVHVYEAKDGQVRRVAVETPKKSFIRPVTRIAPIDVCH